MRVLDIEKSFQAMCSTATQIILAYLLLPTIKLGHESNFHVLIGKSRKGCFISHTIVTHEHNPEKGECVSCRGASPSGRLLANGFSYVWPGFALSLFSGWNIPLQL